MTGIEQVRDICSLLWLKRQLGVADEPNDVILTRSHCLVLCLFGHKGLFTNYVYKKRGVGGQKNSNFVFVNFYTIENVNRGG